MLILSLALMCLPPDSIVHQDGTRLVGHVRMDSTQATIRTTHGTFSFPVEELQQVRTRKELRRTFQNTRKQATSPHARLALAQWCLDQGLYDECFDVLDEAMAETAIGSTDDRPSPVEELLARAAQEAFLDAHHLQETASSERRNLLIVEALGASPSRAWVARRWLSADDQDEVLKQLRPRLSGPKVEARQRAVTLLQQLDGVTPLNELIKMSLKDRAESVQAQARDAVLATGHPGIAKPYLQAAASSSKSMRMAAYPALAALKEPAAVPALIKNLAKANAGNGASPRSHIFQGRQVTIVQDFDVEIAQGAVIADPVLGVVQEGSLLDVRVHGTSGNRYVETQVIVRSLRGMTGQNFGDDFEAWRRWWNESGLLQAKAARELRQKQAQESQ